MRNTKPRKRIPLTLEFRNNIYRLAVEACTDARTAERYLRGTPVSRMAQQLLEPAAARLGVSPLQQGGSNGAA